MFHTNSPVSTNKEVCWNAAACEQIMELARAILSKDNGRVKRLIEEGTRELNILNCCFGPLGVTPLHLACSRMHSQSLVSLLIQHGAQVLPVDKIGRSALHYAAAQGDDQVVRCLISAGANVNCRFEIQPAIQTTSVCNSGERLPNDLFPEYEELPMPDCWGRSPLHQAVKGGHVECVKLLLNHGADANVEDEKGLTPLLLAGADELDTLRHRYEAIVNLLVSNGADVNKINLDTKSSPLYHAVALGSVGATRTLLNAGAKLELSHSQGVFTRAETVLHVAASAGSLHLTRLLLDYGADKFVNWQNSVGCTPLHKAAYNGSRDCLELLINHGGDISVSSDSGMTVIDIIMSYIPRPINFLTGCLDSRVTANSFSINDRDFKVHLDFTVLSPQGCRRQMSVVSSLAVTSQLLQHPLVEAFVLAKWSKLRVFFLIVVMVHLTFVISLSTYILIWIHKKEQLLWSRVVLTLSSCALLIHASTELVLMGKKRLQQFETWLTLINCSFSLLATLYSHSGVDCRGQTVQEEIPCWIRHIASIIILLSWGGLMSLIGRFPTWGYYALMFNAVLKNVMKVFLTFICLVIGFALSFSVQFPYDSEFSNPWRSLVRTTVMMTGEYDYNNLFSGNQSTASNEVLPLVPTSRIIFLLFIFLASVALMNLMVGLAVSDIQGLQTEGNIGRLQKQTDFVSHLEHILAHPMFLGNKQWEWCVPSFISRHHINTYVTIQPSHFADYETLPTYLLETLINIALLNRSKGRRNKTLPLKENIDADGGKDTSYSDQRRTTQNLPEMESNEGLNNLDNMEHLKQLLMETLRALNNGQNQPQKPTTDETDSPAEVSAVSVNAMLRRISIPVHPVSH